LGRRDELACKAVLVLVGVLYVVLMVVSYANARTALEKAGEPEHLAKLLPLGFDVAGTVLVTLSLVLAVRESRGQLVTRVYGIVLVVVSAGIGAWYGRTISDQGNAGDGGNWFDWINWFVAAHALMAVTLAVFAESVAWLLRARIDAAIGVERVPMVLCLTNPGAWREANLYRLRHRSPISSALVARDEDIKAVSRVVEAAQDDAGYTGKDAKKVRAAIMRACRDGNLPVEAIERACENGLDKEASRRLLVDAAKAMMASTANDAITGRKPLAELLGGHDGGQAGDERGTSGGRRGQLWTGATPNRGTSGGRAGDGQESFWIAVITPVTHRCRRLSPRSRKSPKNLSPSRISPTR
jgi:hypothetical protein